MAKNRVSSVSSFHGRPSPKVTKLRRHTSSESLFSLLRLKARFLNDSELCKLNSWFMSHAMQRTIKFWNDNTYFIHLQTFPCPLFHPRPNIPYNWQLSCYKHKFTKIVFICDYIAPAACVITCIAVSVWLHEEQWLQIRSALTGLHQIAGIMRPVNTLTGRVPPEKWKQCEHRKIKTNSSIWELIAGNGQIFEERICHKKSPDRIINWGHVVLLSNHATFFWLIWNIPALISVTGRFK